MELGQLTNQQKLISFFKDIFDEMKLDYNLTELDSTIRFHLYFQIYTVTLDICQNLELNLTGIDLLQLPNLSIKSTLQIIEDFHLTYNCYSGDPTEELSKEWSSGKGYYL